MEKTFTPKEGDWFVSLAYSYEEAKQLKAYIEKKDNDRLYAFYYGEIKEGVNDFIRKPLEDFPKPYFPSFYFKRDITGLEDEFALYQRISIEVECQLP